MTRQERIHNRIRNVRGGLSMIELIVVMGLIAVLAALTLPAVGKARQAARRTQCINNLRNIAFGLTQYDESKQRLPASGYYHIDPDRTHRLHSWAVEILPYINQGNLFDQLSPDRPLEDPANDALRRAQVPVYVCSTDLSRNPEKFGDLSYAVNGGVGFTVRRSGVRDCPVDREWTLLDLNGDGAGCTGDPDVDALDKKLFEAMGMFFLESRNNNVTRRHHSLGDVLDGTSQTFMLAENVRAGFDPDTELANFADSNPYRCAFYIGNPCPGGACNEGNVDYSRCNAGENRINSGLQSAEGSSPIPNSFHEGGVNVAYADGHVQFVSEQIDGAIYAALVSPQGLRLQGLPLEQVIVSGDGF
ncbi:hypothetical protein Mal4_17810 [Maioricimonas rarisocia]|uniref:DUF1559 domain-containing protein n=1 Tax=Maioricimonas rarisocia TaxID=2528026 RepID=A0A517Z4V7_9PLAN|nr:DUF1559 domain-containing protein [Maioricimonas rarisocia]QDU37467.1 hypothetical protein Mal4_17810 [Maioricimonas rarisocia]